MVWGRNDEGSTSVGVVSKKGVSFGRRNFGVDIWEAGVAPVTPAAGRLKGQIHRLG